MRLDIDSLRAFKAVLELGGVTRAARMLNLTQSAVSHKLARLEERVGRPILLKNADGLRATADGRSLLDYAGRLVALHDEAAEHFRASDLSGEIRLGATEDAAGDNLPGVLGRFRRKHPSVAMSIRVSQSLLLARWLEAGDIDLAVLQVFVDEKKKTDHELWCDDLVWATAADHPLAYGGRIPFVSFDANCFYRKAAEKALAPRGQSLEVVLECPSAEGVKLGIRHGLGLGLIGRRHLAPGLVEVTRDLPAFPRVCHVLRSRKGVPGQIKRSLSDAVIAEMSAFT
jgi:DNA-binding transcriptional LysR family regulator